MLQRSSFMSLFKPLCWCLAAPKILNTCGEVILALSFPDNLIFWNAAFLIVFYFSTHYQRIDLF